MSGVSGNKMKSVLGKGQEREAVRVRSLCSRFSLPRER